MNSLSIFNLYIFFFFLLEFKRKRRDFTDESILATIMYSRVIVISSVSKRIIANRSNETKDNYTRPEYNWTHDGHDQICTFTYNTCD